MDWMKKIKYMLQEVRKKVVTIDENFDMKNFILKSPRGKKWVTKHKLSGKFELMDIPKENELEIINPGLDAMEEQDYF